MCAAHAAVANFALLFVRPTAAGDILAGKVDDYIKALEGLDGRLVLIGMPLNLAGLRRGSHEADNRRAIPGERRNQR